MRQYVILLVSVYAGSFQAAHAQDEQVEAAPADEVVGELTDEQEAEPEAAPEAVDETPAESEPAPKEAGGAIAQAKSDVGKESEFGKPDLIANGDRVVVRDGDFSIRPPVGWEVFTQLDNLTLLAQVPHTPGMRYQRTIQVASFSEPRFIDELTAREYENVIVAKFSSVSSAVEDYRIRNHMNVDVADGRKALLFYTEFKLEGVPLMQAHILVSSATRHYLMTFTDVAEHFEDDDASQFLTEAWDSMISVELATRSPQRFETFAAVGVGVVALVVIGFMFIAFRAWRSGKNYQAYADGRDLADDALSDAPRTLSTMQPISDVQKLADDDDEPMTTKDDIAI